MFRLLKKSKISKARLGAAQTAHGKIQTPFFMPDATRAAVKGLANDDLRRLGLEAMVINTYHLYLQPGMEIIKKIGGAHKFMNWSGPLCSDSGGYQVYSLIHKSPSSGKITSDKVVFRSPLDGAKHELTPEKSIQMQFDLGADMIVCLDDCPPHNLPLAEMEKSVARTIAWAGRCRAEYERQIRKRGINPFLGGLSPEAFCPPKPWSLTLQSLLSPEALAKGDGDGVRRGMVKGEEGVGRRPSVATRSLGVGWVEDGGGATGQRRPLLFGVIQGGTNLSLRKKCAEALLQMGLSAKGGPASGWDGLCLGARPVDAQGKFLSKIVSGVADLIPEDKLRFALGTGTPTDIIKCVRAGWDMFDCVIPTREGRHGRLYVLNHPFVETQHAASLRARATTTITITNKKFARDFSPINPNSRLIELRQNSRAYLRHLFKVGEPQAGRLATLNNLEFYLDLMRGLRAAIRNNLL